MPPFFIQFFVLPILSYLIYFPLVFTVMEYVSGTKPTIVAFNMPCVQIPIHIHWTMLMLLQNKILNVQKTLLKLMVSSK